MLNSCQTLPQAVGSRQLSISTSCHTLVLYRASCLCKGGIWAFGSTLRQTVGGGSLIPRLEELCPSHVHTPKTRHCDSLGMEYGSDFFFQFMGIVFSNVYQVVRGHTHTRCLYLINKTTRNFFWPWGKTYQDTKDQRSLGSCVWVGAGLSLSSEESFGQRKPSGNPETPSLLFLQAGPSRAGPGRLWSLP